MKPISVQLYSLRETAAKDFVGVLKRVAEIGYIGSKGTNLPFYGDPNTRPATSSEDGTATSICSSAWLTGWRFSTPRKSWADTAPARRWRAMAQQAWRPPSSCAI
jgi:sugar phosphate isomerase/epimerase